MQLKTLLNHVQKHKGFVYDHVELHGGPRARLVVRIRPDARCRPVCSKCERPAPYYDTPEGTRYFQFVPLWGLLVLFAYTMRWSSARGVGSGSSSFPWAQGKSPTTTAYAWFLARWAKKLSWLEVARSFNTTWDTVFRAVGLAVEWGLQHRDLTGIRAIGVDEVLWHRGHKYLTVVYQIDAHCRRLLWIGEDRTKECIEGFFDWFGLRARWLRFVCSDQHKPYLTAIGRRAKQAVHVLDRFHIVQRLNKAIDQVRAAEVKKLERDGYEPVLKRGRWPLLKRPENLTKKQDAKLRDLLKYNLTTVRAYLLKEELQLLWDYTSATWAGRFLDRWCSTVMRSRIEPMKKLARSFRVHRELLLNWFRARGEISAAVAEGLNNKLKVITRRAYGLRTLKATEIALYHSLGALPEPEGAHRFF
ncbi:MAG: ISL3 family transposase [Myxococcales bacterium]|nr:ISL3 family transposase [Myxococcales bacterium]